MPLGDVVGHVDPAEIEGNARRTGPLERRKPMTGLLRRLAREAEQRTLTEALGEPRISGRASSHSKRPPNFDGR
jgi:hypothetical protein